jgi:glucose-1-phosphate adenylyltransferase
MVGTPGTARMSANTSRVLTIIMGGGAGTRLFPLTKDRAKPAVPLGGKYRIVDIPISNCINSELRRVYLLTQFNSASLHRHIAQSYKFDHFSNGFVEILAAEQTFTDTSWYQGTADAVRKNLVHLLNHDFDYVLILSGDQLYRMDFRPLIAQHEETQAELTIATIPVRRHDAPSLGIMQTNAERRITRFVEKPKEPDLIDSLTIPRDMYDSLGLGHDTDDLLLASMGIYVFNRDVLTSVLAGDATDFGKHIIPGAIESRRVSSYVFQGYWEDIGTIRAFFEANLDLASELPRFNFFDMTAPIFSRPRYLPASKINGARIDHAIISDGCIITHADIHQSIVGIRSVISAGARLHRVIMLGSDFYESAASIADREAIGNPRIGIGTNTVIENAIIDKNARIGNDVFISPRDKPESMDHPLYFIRDGIVIVPKNAIVPHGTVI